MRLAWLAATALLLSACADASPAFRAAACLLPAAPTGTEQEREALGRRASELAQAFSGKPLSRRDSDLYFLVVSLPTFAAAPEGAYSGTLPPAELKEGLPLPRDLPDALRLIRSECAAR